MNNYVLNLATFLSWLCLVVFFSLFSLVVSAAPIPATSSSILISAERQLFRSTHGFSISGEGTSWLLEEPSAQQNYLTSFRAPIDASQARLTVRVDQMETVLPLRMYVRRWIKDYPRLGFDVLSAQQFSVKGQVGFLVDLLNKSTNRQLRQAIFTKERTAVILNCSDVRSQFSMNVKSCNELIRNFKWDQPPKTSVLLTK